MSDDLVAFLRARIDDAAVEAPNIHAGYCGSLNPYGAAGDCDCGRPARELAEVEAKRKLIELAYRQWDHATNFDYYGIDDDDTYRLLALPYADHADYREEWRPSAE
jgi:hypothetical protein